MQPTAGRVHLSLNVLSIRKVTTSSCNLGLCLVSSSPTKYVVQDVLLRRLLTISRVSAFSRIMKQWGHATHNFCYISMISHTHPHAQLFPSTCLVNALIPIFHNRKNTEIIFSRNNRTYGNTAPRVHTHITVLTTNTDLMETYLSSVNSFGINEYARKTKAKATLTTRRSGGFTTRETGTQR